MGHAIEYRIYDDTKDIKKLEAQMLSDAREFAFYNVDRGENPTGSYHECFRQKADYIAEDEKAAQSILNKGFYSDGWVRYKAYEPSKTAKAAESSIPKLRQARIAYSEKTRAEFLNRKSQFVGCKNCSSKLSLKYMNNCRCPVCGYDLRPQSAKDKLDDYDAKINAAKEKAKEKSDKCKVKIMAKFEVHC